MLISSFDSNATDGSYETKVSFGEANYKPVIFNEWLQPLGRHLLNASERFVF